MEEPKTSTPRRPRTPKAEVPKIETHDTKTLAELSKAAATAAGEPWVGVLSIDLDPNDLGNGSFELDWNDTFLARLVKAGYQGKNDVDIVDRWFQTICRSVVAENYEQWDANFTAQRRMDRQDLGGGKSSVS